MTVADINTASGIRGVPLEVAYFDDKSDPELSIEVMETVRDSGM